MLEHWIWLAQRPNLNDHKKNELLRFFGSPEHIWDAATEELAEACELSAQALESLGDHSLSGAVQALEACDKQGIELITIHDAAYPRRLAEIYDPPTVLFYRGVFPDFDDLPAIGVVGTRKPSAYGLNTARRLGREITMCGGLVVSGMAGGIDSAAMKGALESGGKTVAVLGCGVDVIYPRSNRGLYEDTCRYGCVISEFLPGTSPLKWNFPRRNRIISGLSCGVVVVEAPDHSGSVITARHALDQGRDVFAVPGNVDQECSAGSNRLLRDGAGAVGTGWDILSEYAGLFPEQVKKPDDSAGSHRRKASHSERRNASDRRAEIKTTDGHEKKGIDNRNQDTYIGKKFAGPALSPDEQIIADALVNGPQLTDDVIAQTGLPSGKVLGLLTLLEIKGVISRLPGKRISLRNR